MSRTALLALLALLALTSEAMADGRVTVADPGGGARWSATQTTAADGRTCTTLARGRSARPRSCARLAGATVFDYSRRLERSVDPRRTRTILVASFAPNVVSATLRTPDGTRTYRRRNGRPRLMLAVLAGRVELPVLTVRVSNRGRVTTIRSRSLATVQALDPFGAAPWRTIATRGGCVAWERVPPRYAETPEPDRGAPRCGDPDVLLPVAAAQAVDGRVVVFGLAGARAQSVTLRLPDGTTRALRIEPATRAFLAVLPAGVDPAALRVAARDGDAVDDRPVTVVE
jgi:hypothetical protein